MSRISMADFLKITARLEPKQHTSKTGVDKESDLHADIIQYCRSKGWLFFHGAMCAETHRTEGEPDFLIFRPGGFLLVECKTRTGKLSIAQQSVSAQAKQLGHTVHIVRSMEEFLKL